MKYSTMRNEKQFYLIENEQFELNAAIDFIAIQLIHEQMGYFNCQTRILIHSTSWEMSKIIKNDIR